MFTVDRLDEHDCLWVSTTAAANLIVNSAENLLYRPSGFDEQTPKFCTPSLHMKQLNPIILLLWP